MEVEKQVQRTVKLSEKGYDRLEMLRDMLGEFYRKKISFDDAIMWLVIKSAIEIHGLNSQLITRQNELRDIDNPLEAKTAFEEIQAARLSAKAEKAKVEKGKADSSTQNPH